jgi:acyl-coenzyme A synthetase/AMP-(fatty) acid ligase
LLPLPLIGHRSLDAVVAYRNGEPIRAVRFLADASRVIGCLPPGKRHLLNLCQDRYRFAVGLVAAALDARVSLLPSSLTPDMLHQMAVFAPDAFCLTDRAGAAGPLPTVRFPDGEPDPETDPPVPMLQPERLVAYVFTSGSTGVPIPHEKHWGMLVRNIRCEAERLGLGDGRAHSIVGTVPPQHMYGLETTVLLALQSGSALVAERPFFPADIRASLEAVPEPRILVTTPIHLRALIASGIDLPALDLVVSATAPLSRSLAYEVETELRAPLIEIYGCTETGQLATRYPTRGPEWRLFPGVHLESADDGIWASGGHVEGRVRLGDLIEPTGERCFLLQGRSSDLVNVGGKRTSLAYLNHQLNSVPGVLDGAFYLPDPEEGAADVTRLTALVVAPGLDAATLLAELRLRTDPVFLPRPLLFVDALPRNATGKLPRQALEELLRRRDRRPGDTGTS